MSQKKDQSVSSQVQERLQELFTEDNEMDNDDLFKNAKEPVDAELRELKAVVLSIDWEITDEIMSKLLQQIETLKTVYQDDRIRILFLQLLGTVGKYIQAKKASAHPDSIKLLNSAYQSFEEVVTNKQLSEHDRKKLLQKEVARFKDLKDHIIYKGMTPAGEIRETEYQKAEVKRAQGIGNDRMPPETEAILEEIRKIIQNEFKSMKEELKIWIKEQS